MRSLDGMKKTVFKLFSDLSWDAQFVSVLGVNIFSKQFTMLYIYIIYIYIHEVSLLNPIASDSIEIRLE